MHKELKREFTGIGEVSGYRFACLRSDGYAYLYEVSLVSEDGLSILERHYEVFERRVNELYDCEKYPRSKAFGDWAFTYRSSEYDLAMSKFDELSARVKCRIESRG